MMLKALNDIMTRQVDDKTNFGKFLYRLMT